jgi:adenylosuccinate synthase
MIGQQLWMVSGDWLKEMVVIGQGSLMAMMVLITETNKISNQNFQQSRKCSNISGHHSLFQH